MSEKEVYMTYCADFLGVIDKKLELVKAGSQNIHVAIDELMQQRIEHISGCAICKQVWTEKLREIDGREGKG